ncbi:MAG: DNA/RNA non-specific endonuclease [candidate division WOR-3 bacterium]
MARSSGRSYWILVLVALAAVLVGVRRRRYRESAVAGPVLAIADTGLVRLGRPLGHEQEGVLLTKTHYQCLHDSRLKVSRWVAYRAQGDDTSGLGRYPGDFYAEPSLEFGQRAEVTDYKGIWKSDQTGYDRGHQAPDATLKVFGREAQRETYSLANVTPQHSQINQGVWSDIEAQIRRWSSVNRPVWVVTGPAWFAGMETTWVGSQRVAVPHAYYAVLDRGPELEVLAFLVENRTEAPWYGSLAGFVVSVDSVERLTGLDFLPGLPDSIENHLEARAARLWQ